MVIEAAEPLLASRRGEVTIVGDGPERKSLEQLAARSANPGAIRFTGAIPHDDVQQHFAAADLFVFPSIREFGGAVVLEAMAMGAVPLVVNYGGPAELVTEETGMRVEVGPRANIVQALREAMETVAANPSSLLPKMTNGRSYIGAHFTWEAKARQVVGIYHKVLETIDAERAATCYDSHSSHDEDSAVSIPSPSADQRTLS